MPKVEQVPRPAVTVRVVLERDGARELTRCTAPNLRLEERALAGGQPAGSAATITGRPPWSCHCERMVTSLASPA